MEPHWYNEQTCTEFQSLQHRKERSGVRHEFIVIEFTNGSICRIERMGDPEAPLYSLSAAGILARDVAECFPNKAVARLDTSEVVSQISLPYALDLKFVLCICRAIHEAERTHNYTLRGYNCYFFALTIQACLTRRFARWENLPVIRSWHSALDKLTPNNHQPQPLTRTQSFSTLLHLVSRTQEWDIDQLYQDFVEEFKRLLLDPGLSTSVRNILYSELWYTQLDLPMHLLLESLVKEAMILAICTQIRAFIVTRHDSESHFRGAVILAWLHRFTNGPKRHSQAQMARLMHTSRQTYRSFNKPRLVHEFDYHPPNSLCNPEPLTLTQWWIIICAWVNLQNALLRFLLVAHIILGAYGIVLITKGSPKSESCVVVEKELDKIASSWNPQQPLGAQELDTLTEELFKKYEKGTAFWEIKPWDGAFEALKAALPCWIPSPNSRVSNVSHVWDNRWSLREDKKSISAFQAHILARIESHAKLVKLMSLGSATEIKIDLEQKMTEIWGLIRDDDSKNNGNDEDDDAGNNNGNITMPALVPQGSPGPQQHIILFIGADTPTGNDIDYLRQMFDSSPHRASIRYECICGSDATLAKVRDKVLTLFNEARNLPNSPNICLLFSGTGNENNAMCLADGSALSESDLSQWISASAIDLTKRPVSVLFDICRRNPSRPAMALQPAELAWSCSVGESAYALRLRENKHAPRSIFLLAMFMAAHHTKIHKEDESFFEAAFASYIKQLNGFIRLAYDSAHQDRCPFCPPGRLCDPPVAQNPDLQHGRRAITDLGMVIATHFPEHTRDVFDEVDRKMQQVGFPSVYAP
ncbi:unnamed protein product [Rhizoctonia solani]|uniref:Peptidase C14 caspase domain-containing protein n=1 Tax=Rhizoctonia solani TaxID=456999 RepID=A0A8H3B2E9_9AGAM|nr:unnamed protein product [Rhizoctonia solani]